MKRRSLDERGGDWGGRRGDDRFDERGGGGGMRRDVIHGLGVICLSNFRLVDHLSKILIEKSIFEGGGGGGGGKSGRSWRICRKTKNS